MTSVNWRMMFWLALASSAFFAIVGIWSALPWQESRKNVEYDGKVVRCIVWSKWPIVVFAPEPFLPEPSYYRHPPQYIKPSTQANTGQQNQKQQDSVGRRETKKLNSR